MSAAAPRRPGARRPGARRPGAGRPGARRFGALLVALFVAAAAAGCAGSTRSYHRAGTAGAVTVLGGLVVRVVGVEVVQPDHPDTGRAMSAIGITSQVAGLLLALYALDGLMRREAEADMGGSIGRRSGEPR